MFGLERPVFRWTCYSCGQSDVLYLARFSREYTKGSAVLGEKYTL